MNYLKKNENFLFFKDCRRVIILAKIILDKNWISLQKFEIDDSQQKSCS